MIDPFHDVRDKRMGELSPDQMAELATQLRYAKNLLPTWLDEAEFHAYEEDLDRAADLIAGMAQRTNQWAFDRLVQRVPLSEEEILKHISVTFISNPCYDDAMMRSLKRLARAIEQAHGITAAAQED